MELIEFETVQSGVLTAKILPGGRIELEFPARDVVPVEYSLNKKVRKLLPRVFKNGLQPSVNSSGRGRRRHTTIILLLSSTLTLTSKMLVSSQILS